MVICLERGADLHTAQLMLLPLTASCFSKIQIGFTFLVPAHPGSPGQRAVKWVCVCRCTATQRANSQNVSTLKNVARPHQLILSIRRVDRRKKLIILSRYLTVVSCNECAQHTGRKIKYILSS